MTIIEDKKERVLVIQHRRLRKNPYY
jgi:hypothetical protein